MIVREVASIAVTAFFVLGVLFGFEIGQENADKQSILQTTPVANPFADEVYGVDEVGN